MTEVACDYCEEGNVAVDGWHTIKDPMGFDGDQRIPCANRKTEESEDIIAAYDYETEGLGGT